MNSGCIGLNGRQRNQNCNGHPRLHICGQRDRELALAVWMRDFQLATRLYAFRDNDVHLALAPWAARHRAVDWVNFTLLECADDGAKRIAAYLADLLAAVGKLLLCALCGRGRGVCDLRHSSSELGVIWR